MYIIGGRILIGISLFLAAVGAQAMSCSGECRISYTDDLGALPYGSTWDQIEDFKANCTQFLHGTVTYGTGNNEYLCWKSGEERTSVTGEGSDILQARTDARDCCKQRASSSGHSRASGSIYGAMTCQ